MIKSLAISLGCGKIDDVRQTGRKQENKEQTMRISDATMNADFVLFDPVHHVYIAWFGGSSTQLHMYDAEGGEFSVTSYDNAAPCLNRETMLAFAFRRMASGEYPFDN